MALKVKAVFVNWGYMSSTPTWPQTLPVQYIICDSVNTQLTQEPLETQVVVQQHDEANTIQANAVAAAKAAEAALGRTVNLP